MKYGIIISSRFKKDLKIAKKRGKDLNKLFKVVDMLSEGKKLDPKYRDHALTGNMIGKRECHIEPDFLLIYKIDHYEIILYLVRTGTHSDLL